MTTVHGLVVFAVLALGATRVEAQEQGDAPKEPVKTAPSHGIIRKGQPRPAQPINVAPAASNEAVAAAIAAAVKAVEETKPPAQPRVRSPRAPARAVPQRRYVVQWPSQRVQVKWDEPDPRVRLEWTEMLP